jgi:hypothetical protein
MRKLIALLLALGAIVLVGGLNHSLAQVTNPIFLQYALLDDSSNSQSEQAKTEQSFIYVKSGPADPGKVVGEFVAGGVGAVIVGTLLGSIGYGIGHEETSGWLDFDEGGFIGAAVGYLVGSNLGCASGVCVVGNSGGEKGSYLTTLGGSLLGTMVGGVIAIAIMRNAEDDDSWAPMFLVTAAQSGGATSFFNSSRKRRVEIPCGALLNLNDNELSLAFPRVNASLDSFGSADFRLDLFQANF